MTQLQEQLAQAFPQLPWQWDKNLAESTYFRIGGPAEAYLELSDEQTLVKLVQHCRRQQIHVTLLGGASNVIVADEGVKGVVVRLTDTTVSIIPQADNTAEVVAGAGCKMALLVSQVVAAGYAGLEYFLGVPGTVGGATYNNAHYLSHLISEFILGVRVITASGEVVWLDKAACDFAYDQSRFQQTKEIILAVKFVVPAGERAASQQLIKEATEYRARTQPLGEPSSGCIFQNVPVTPALLEQFPQFVGKTHISGGFIIDQAGLKGRRVGDIEVSHKHAAFFVNKGRGTAAEVKALIAQVKAAVKERFGINLQEEVFYIN